MGTMRFESNDVKNLSTVAKVLHFDSSYQRAISQITAISPENIALKNERKSKRGETVWDVFGHRDDQKPSKLGELFHHSPDWPGGPAERKPLSTL